MIGCINAVDFSDGIKAILRELGYLVHTYVVRGGAAAGNSSIVMP